ncbi:MAG TPA: glycoside hydrolase family 3 N-terminal domain-containing protein [Candidatus Limnocylindrales bacterium]
MTPERILERVMLAFEGERVPRWVERRLAEAPAAGLTLFVGYNVRDPAQVRELTAAFQRAGAAGEAGEAGGKSGVFGGPMLVAADQEGGQLIGLGEASTPFAGNMALGAAGDEDLTERVGRAIGREARAMGVNVVYAPVLDLANEPANSNIGIRSFGDIPAEVGRLGAAMVRGLQSAGVAATVKHFPGLGAVARDSHHGLGVVEGTREEVLGRELAPFRAAIAAGARLAMSAHVAVPALTGDRTLPATLSRVIMDGTLRGELGFRGVSISDALDMRALAQGAAQAVEVIAAIRAGDDLLLTSADQTARRRIERTLVAAAARQLFEPADLEASAARLAELRAWLAAAGSAPDLDVVGSAEHLALSRELAERALTRTDRGPGGAEPAPLALASATRILAIMPEPTDLTPADTSSMVAPGLGRALRTRFASVDDVVVGDSPSDAEIAGLRGRAASFDAVVVGTIEAHRQPSQAALVRAIAETGVPTIAVALRTPWDVAVYPEGVPAICTYSILRDSLEALARALAGEIGFPGRLPVAVVAPAR